MTAVRDDLERGDAEAGRDCTLIWIDAREAVIAHWRAGEVRLERLLSDVPAHHRSTGHVRYDPSVRHGGVGPRAAAEQQRLEHLARFVELVATRVRPRDDLLILGPGTVRERLDHRIREADRHGSRARNVTCRASARLTDRQLIARLRHLAGGDRQRRTTGPYRSTETTIRRASGSPMPAGRRVGPKPRIDPIDVDIAQEDMG